MTKSNRLKIQERKYLEILTHNPRDFIAMKCLIEILENRGDKTLAKDYNSKFSILKNEWIANYKTTEKGEKLDKRFKNIANMQDYNREGYIKNWDEFWSNQFNDDSIDSVEFHVYRSEEILADCPDCSMIYMEVAELINDGGDKIAETLLDIASEQNSIDDQIEMCLQDLETNPNNCKALKLLAKYAFHNLDVFPVDQVLMQFDKLYREHEGWSDPEIVLYRGMIYACIGEIQKSLKMLKKIKKIECRSRQQNIVMKDIPEAELCSKKLEIFLAGIIRETEGKNIN